MRNLLLVATLCIAGQSLLSASVCFADADVLTKRSRPPKVVITGGARTIDGSCQYVEEQSELTSSGYILLTEYCEGLPTSFVEQSILPAPDSNVESEKELPSMPFQ